MLKKACSKQLRFSDTEIERKYYEDEYPRMMEVLTYQVYFSSITSVGLVIIAFISEMYSIYFGSALAVMIISFGSRGLAAKFPYSCNEILSANNILWCGIVSAVLFWTVPLIESTNTTTYFAIGGGFYSIHVALLIGTNFLLNIATFTVINLVYVLSVLPSIPHIIVIIIMAPLVVGFTMFKREKNTRLYYELINKYYIWYHIANNVLPHKFIITKPAPLNSVTSTQARQLVNTNRKARKEFQINSDEDLRLFISSIDLKQDSQQNIIVNEDTNNRHNLDSQVSKSFGVMSQFSKKSFTSRYSQQPPQQQHNSNSRTTQPQRLVALDLVMKREIRGQYTVGDNNIIPQEQASSHGPPTGNPIHALNGHMNANDSGRYPQQNNLPVSGLTAGGLQNTTTQDQGAIHVRNQKRSLYQMEDSIGASSMKQRKAKRGQSSKTKVQKFKGMFRSDPEERRRMIVTLVGYTKEEFYQLIMIEEDTNQQREQLLEEQINQCKSISVNFANIMQNESSMLQYYLNQMKQNLQIQKKLTDAIADAFHLNTNLSLRVGNFLEFQNLDSAKIELTPKSFSLKKLIKEITSSVDLRLKQIQTQVIISNDGPEIDMIYNDENRLRHVIHFLLQDCLQNSQKGQIVISTSSGATEIGDFGDLTMQGTVKVTIRDNSQRKYPKQKNPDFHFSSQGIGRIIQNKARSYQEIEASVCKQLLRHIGPQSNIFYLSDDRNTNRVSFYIYRDLSRESINPEWSNAKQLFQDDENEQQFEAQILNSDDDEDSFKNNNQSPVAQDIVQENKNNAFTGSNQAPSSIYLFHGVDTRNIANVAQQQNSSHSINPMSQSYQAQNIQVASSLQSGQLISHATSLIPSQMTQHSNSSSSSALNPLNEKARQIYLQTTQSDRRIQQDQKQQTLQINKSMNELFEENDQVEDENNQVSDVHIKELSQTSVRFKQDITRRMSQKITLFRNSSDELDQKFIIPQKIQQPAFTGSSQTQNPTASKRHKA